MSKFSPMLAESGKEEDFKFPLYASFKRDGFRASVVDGQLMSRTQKPIPNEFISSYLSHPAYDGLDGELIVGPDTAKNVFPFTSGQCRTTTGQPDFTFWVFELHNGGGVFAERVSYMERLFSQGNVPERIRMVEQKLCNNLSELLAYEKVALALGYEGLVTRAPHSPYVNGRPSLESGYFVRLTRRKRAEARILGVIEGIVNGPTGPTLGGTMGALLLEDLETGCIFSCNGRDTAMRDAYWAERKQPLEAKKRKGVTGVYYEIARENVVVTYSFFPQGNYAAPRHPIFEGERDPVLDMS